MKVWKVQVLGRSYVVTGADTPQGAWAQVLARKTDLPRDGWVFDLRGEFAATLSRIVDGRTVVVGHIKTMRTRR